MNTSNDKTLIIDKPHLNPTLNKVNKLSFIYTWNYCDSIFILPEFVNYRFHL